MEQSIVGSNITWTRRALCTALILLPLWLNGCADDKKTDPPPANTFDLTVSLTGSGQVTSSPAGIACGSDCAETLAAESSITLSAAPASGFTFSGWNGDCDGTTSCALTMSANRAVTATFTATPVPPPVQFTLTVNVTGNGSVGGGVSSNLTGILCPGDCTEILAAGSSVTLSATPTSGFTFSAWSGDCNGSTSCALTMSENRAVTATFTTPVPPPASALVTSTNLLHLGVINIAHNDGNCADTPNARGTGLTYNPSGNNGAGSFYITGRLSTHCIAEITKPAVGGTATFIQGYRDPTNGTAAGVPGGSNGAFIGGHLLHNGSLYVTAFTYYDAAVEQNVAIWKRSPTLTDNTGLTGPSAAGPGNQGMYNQYMDNVPASFQSMLGGPAVIGGCCFSIISRTSLGPALYSFNPESLGTVTALVGYPDGNQTLNPWGAAGSHPEANPTTKMGGVTFVEGSDTVLFVGTTGKGEYCYGTSCTDPNYPGVQGAHAYPYVHYMWAYDIKELAKVKSGAKKMWEVFPYAHWELPDMGSVGADEWSATGIAFDSSTSYLYVLKSREPGGAAWPQIHVYRVTGL